MASKSKYPPPPAKPKSAKATTSVAVANTDGEGDDYANVAEGRRLSTVDGARTIYDRLIADNMQRSSTYASVRNQLEGGRPRDPAELVQNGEAWSCNVNFGDAQAARNRVLQPFWKMVNDVPHRATFSIDSAAPQSDEWQASFAEAFDDFHDDWGADYYLQFMQVVANYINFGPGPAQFCSDEMPRYKAVNPTRLLFPMNTKMSPDEWEVVALVRDMSASELYGYIRDKKTAKNSEYAGWNIKAIKATIVQCKDGGPAPDYRDYTRLADQLVNNDITITTPFMPQAVVWLYVRQFPKAGEKKGRVGCYAFTQNAGVNDFLYKDEDQYESFRQLLPTIWYDTGTDGMVHSIKGFGIKNYYFSMLQNRMKSRMMDSATFSLGINFQYADGNTPDETPPVENYGAFSIFPTGLTQLAIYPQLKAASDVLGLLENNAAENNSLYKQNNEQIAQTDTATQANILANMQGQTAESSASIFLSQLGENFYSEQLRRLRIKGSGDEDAKNFQKRLKAKGVPDEVIFNSEVRVKTGANAGMWNPAMRAQAFQEGLALASLPGVNTRWFLENFIAYKYGANAVNKALLPEGEQSSPVQRRQAQMENQDFGQGAPLQAAPSDAHVEHIEEHMKPVAGIAAKAKQGQQLPPEQTSALAITVEHMGQHMAFLQRDETKKKEFNALLPQFRLLQNITKGLLMQMQKQQQQPDQQGQVVPMNAAQ